MVVRYFDKDYIYLNGEKSLEKQEEKDIELPQSGQILFAYKTTECFASFSATAMIIIIQTCNRRVIGSVLQCIAYYINDTRVQRLCTNCIVMLRATIYC